MFLGHKQQKLHLSWRYFFQASGQWTLHTDVKLENSRRFFCPLFLIAPSLPWEDPKEVAGSPLNGAQWHLKYCC